MQPKLLPRNNALFLRTFLHSRPPTQSPKLPARRAVWIADRKTSRFSVFWAAADAVNVFAASEMGIEKRGHLRGGLVWEHTAALIGSRGYLIFSCLRIRDPVLLEQRPQRRVFLFKLHDSGLQCIHNALPF